MGGYAGLLFQVVIKIRYLFKISFNEQPGNGKKIQLKDFILVIIKVIELIFVTLFPEKKITCISNAFIIHFLLAQ